jgi:hypothetical protein
MIFTNHILNELIEKFPLSSEKMKLTMLFALIDGATTDPDARPDEFLDDLRHLLEVEVVA